MGSMLVISLVRLRAGARSCSFVTFKTATNYSSDFNFIWPKCKNSDLEDGFCSASVSSLEGIVTRYDNGICRIM